MADPRPPAPPPGAPPPGSPPPGYPAPPPGYPQLGGLPAARAMGGRPFPSWAVALAMLPPGWIYIFRAHRWHLTPSVVVLGLCWLAVIGAGYAMVRAAAAVIDHAGDNWWTVSGSRDELEREKRSLMRAIKEIEFDRDTGKVAPMDAQAMIAVYRARAIDVIKTMEIGGGLSPRERILAELKVRAEIDGKAARAAQKAAKAAKKKQDKQDKKADAKVVPIAPPVAAAAAEPESDSESEPESESESVRESESESVRESEPESVRESESDPVAASVAVPVSAPEAAKQEEAS